jgi:ribosomal protein S27AE
MPYSKEITQTTCPGCGVLLDILTEWAGDYRANERERAECPKCGTIAASDKCLGITATVAKDADD